MTMLEKVAEALHFAENKFHKENSASKDYADRAYANLAHAALTAMLEPTPFMLNEGTIRMTEPAFIDSKPIFQAMIRAALNEHEKETP